MKNTIIGALAGALISLLIYLKNKHPDIVNVSGDLIEEQKIKDNRKIKNKGKQVDSNGNEAMINGMMSRRDVIKLWKSLKSN